MSGYSAELLNDQTKHHWSVKLFDRENGLADRNAHFSLHKARLAEFKKQNPGAIGELISGNFLQISSLTSSPFPLQNLEVQ